MQRPSGFYRVKEDGKWTIARYHASSGYWASMGEGGDCDDDSWEEIDSERISMPGDEQPEVDLTPSLILQTVFFEFVLSESPAKELNQTLSLVREKFNDTGHRIINVETVEPHTFMGFQLKAGGLRIWYEAQSSPTPMELVQHLWDQVST